MIILVTVSYAKGLGPMLFLVALCCSFDFSQSFSLSNLKPKSDTSRETFEEYLTNPREPLSLSEKRNALQHMVKLLSVDLDHKHPLHRNFLHKRSHIFRDLKRSRCCDLDLFCFGCGEEEEEEERKDREEREERRRKRSADSLTHAHRAARLQALAAHLY